MRPLLFPRALLACSAAALLVLIAFSGCSDDDEGTPMGPGGPTSTQLVGGFIGTGDGGSMALQVNTTTLAPALRASLLGSHEVTATAVLYPDVGGTISLTGTYSDESDSLALSGSGYDMAGVYDTTGTIPGIVGEYTGPNGSGLFGCLLGSTSQIQTYCATWENEAQDATGRWTMIVVGNDLVGGITRGDQVLGFEGTSTGTGTTRTLTIAGGEGTTALTAEGTLDLTTNTLTGTWTLTVDDVVQDTGTWSGSLCPTGATYGARPVAAATSPDRE